MAVSIVTNTFDDNTGQILPYTSAFHFESDYVVLTSHDVAMYARLHDSGCADCAYVHKRRRNSCSEAHAARKAFRSVNITTKHVAARPKGFVAHNIAIRLRRET